MLHGQMPMATEQGLGLNHDMVANPVAGINACQLLDNCAEVLGSEVKHVGVEAYFTAFSVVFYNSLVKMDKEFLTL